MEKDVEIEKVTLRSTAMPPSVLGSAYVASFTTTSHFLRVSDTADPQRDIVCSVVQLLPVVWFSKKTAGRFNQCSISDRKLFNNKTTTHH